jgi:hypothetical protein
MILDRISPTLLNLALYGIRYDHRSGIGGRSSQRRDPTAFGSSPHFGRALLGVNLSQGSLKTQKNGNQLSRWVPLKM